MVIPGSNKNMNKKHYPGVPPTSFCLSFLPLLCHLHYSSQWKCSKVQASALSSTVFHSISDLTSFLPFKYHPCGRWIYLQSWDHFHSLSDQLPVWSFHQRPKRQPIILNLTQTSGLLLLPVLLISVNDTSEPAVWTNKLGAFHNCFLKPPHSHLSGLISKLV